MARYEYTPDGIVGRDELGQIVLPKVDVAPPVVVMAKAPPARLIKAPPQDIVKLAKARLREVQQELKRLTKLQKERDELTRLIAAAEARPLAVVREMSKRSS